MPPTPEITTTDYPYQIQQVLMETVYEDWRSDWEPVLNRRPVRPTLSDEEREDIHIGKRRESWEQFMDQLRERSLSISPDYMSAVLPAYINKLDRDKRTAMTAFADIFLENPQPKNGANHYLYFALSETPAIINTVETFIEEFGYDPAKDPREVATACLTALLGTGHTPGTANLHGCAASHAHINEVGSYTVALYWKIRPIVEKWVDEIIAEKPLQQ